MKDWNNNQPKTELKTLQIILYFLMTSKSLSDYIKQKIFHNNFIDFTYHWVTIIRVFPHLKYSFAYSKHR